jgi:8-oxo-dGTP pyrophosphatase MutT (NUDIX family)
VIRCACLLDTTEDSILLVRVRNNVLWYLPGGTIEDGETNEDALVREIDEELGVILDKPSIRFDRVVTGPALGRNGKVELNCYRARWNGKAEAKAEISELSYLPFERLDKMAPAVRKLVSELKSDGNNT